MEIIIHSNVNTTGEAHKLFKIQIFSANGQLTHTQLREKRPYHIKHSTKKRKTKTKGKLRVLDSYNVFFSPGKLNCVKGQQEQDKGPGE